MSIIIISRIFFPYPHLHIEARQDSDSELSVVKTANCQKGKNPAKTFHKHLKDKIYSMIQSIKEIFGKHSAQNESFRHLEDLH